MRLPIITLAAVALIFTAMSVAVFADARPLPERFVR